MQARGFLNYRLKYWWPKVIYGICQPKELKREITKKLGKLNRGPTKNLGGHGPPRPLRISTVRGTWHSKNWRKLNWLTVLHISIWGGLELCFGKLSSPKPLVATGLARSKQKTMLYCHRCANGHKAVTNYQPLPKSSSVFRVL